MGNCICKKREDNILESLSESSSILDKANSLSVNDFKIKSMIGSGSTSEVFLVQRKKNLKHYAMKVITKQFIQGTMESKHVKAERSVLETLNHPFLIKFHYAFQNKSKLYLVLEYAQGGDLYNYLNKMKVLTEEQCRFYAAEIICALEYLHKKNLVFRGLQPEDVLLDSEGHVKLSDFGLAKSNQSFTSSFCGSPLYIAPETIKGEKQTFAVDWWSLGVLIYEMLTGSPPFWSSDNKTLLKKIIQKQFKMSEKISEEAKDLITKLLDINPLTRLGSGSRG